MVLPMKSPEDAMCSSSGQSVGTANGDAIDDVQILVWELAWNDEREPSSDEMESGMYDKLGVEHENRFTYSHCTNCDCASIRKFKSAARDGVAKRIVSHDHSVAGRHTTQVASQCAKCYSISCIHCRGAGNVGTAR